MERFVDRDMLMRFHWGLAVGHTYTHRRRSEHAGVLWPCRDAGPRSASGDRSTVNDGGGDAGCSGGDHQDVGPQHTNDPDLGSESEGEGGLGFEEDEQEPDEDSEDEQDIDSDEGSEDEREALALDEMYGDVGSDEEDD